MILSSNKGHNFVVIQPTPLKTCNCCVANFIYTFTKLYICSKERALTLLFFNEIANHSSIYIQNVKKICQKLVKIESKKRIKRW